jgi:hypothetical protein
VKKPRGELSVEQQAEYRELKKKTKHLYRDPGFLICTDPQCRLKRYSKPIYDSQT